MNKMKQMVTIEVMPEYLCECHRAANNWGVYPFNGAERMEVTLEEAQDIIVSDEYNYAHIVEDEYNKRS